MATNIADLFHKYFEMVPATTAELKESAFRIRYEVYCLENSFEDPRSFPDGMEKDEYDAHSEHCLILHRETNLFAATARLILPDPNDLDSCFPTERHCLIERADLLQGIPRPHMAEISRLCVSSHFKRRKYESYSSLGIAHKNYYPTPLDYDKNRRILPNFTLALFSCLLRMSAQHGITCWYALMENQVARLFRTLGINFVPIGPTVEYRGQRKPYFIKVADLLAGVKCKDLSAWELLSNYGEYPQDGEHADGAK
ncbi:MAG: PEP-CTERM/exosortase system-associated acyltransferase [Candidatus Methylumidiphilus sp.]